MKPWVDLYRSHGELRTASGRDVENDIRKVLRNLSQRRPVFDSHIHTRFNPTDSARAQLRTVELGLKGRGEPIKISKLTASERQEIGLKSAHLTVQLLVGLPNHHLHMFTTMIEGIRDDDSTWAIAVHLPDDRKTDMMPDCDRQGHGGCGHAALHCHVGPTLDVLPKVRVPLPPLNPPQLVEWVLSQVVPIPEFEPAPWSSVMQALAPPNR